MESKCNKNPNEEIIRELAQEDLSLLKMLATNGKNSD